MIGSYYIKNQDGYEEKLVKIDVGPNFFYLKDTWSGKVTEIAIPSDQEIKYIIKKRDDIWVHVQIFVNVDRIINYIEIPLNTKNEARISEYLNIPEISISIETINIRRILLAKMLIFVIVWPVLLMLISLLFSSLGLIEVEWVILGFPLSILISLLPYIKLNKRQKTMLLEKEKIAVETLSKYELDWALIDLQNKITPMDMYAIALGYNPDELTEALIKEDLWKPTDPENL